MIRPAKIFEWAVKHQMEQNRKKANGAATAAETAAASAASPSAGDVVNPSNAPVAADDINNAGGIQATADDTAGGTDGAECAEDKKRKFKVPSVRPKIGTVL